MDIQKPLLRGHFHQAMFFVSLGACSLLISSSDTIEQLIASITYSIGLLLMFGISALYHRVNWSPDARAILKKLDHSAIFVMIAGSFTPVTLLALSEESGMTLLKIIWAVAFAGILKCVFYSKSPKWVNVLMYMIAGYLIMPYIVELAESVGAVRMWLLALGGAAYTIGGISYGLQYPKLNPKVFGYHELFHVLVSIAAVLHFIVVKSLMV